MDGMVGMMNDSYKPTKNNNNKQPNKGDRDSTPKKNNLQTNQVSTQAAAQKQ